MVEKLASSMAIAGNLGEQVITNGRDVERHIHGAKVDT